jgi:hypothetical protein
MEELDLSSYRQKEVFTGVIFISVGVFGTFEGLLIVAFRRCPKPFLLIYGMTSAFVFFSFLLFGSGLLMI